MGIKGIAKNWLAGVLLLLCGPVAFASVALTAPMPPQVVDWSNTSTRDRDTIFLVKSGERVSFTVRTARSCEHCWSVLKGSKVLSARAEKDVNESSFTWDIPEDKGNWEIELEAYDHIPQFGPAQKAHLTWTLTTAGLKTLKPGESIQAAMDSLPPEGGVVELLEGGYSADSERIRVNRSNVILRGAGMDKTVVDKAIDVTKGHSGYERYQWHYCYKDDSWLFSPHRAAIPMDKFARYSAVRDLETKGQGIQPNPKLLEYHRRVGVNLRPGQENWGDLGLGLGEAIECMVSDVRAPGICIGACILTMTKRCVFTSKGSLFRSRSCSVVECVSEGGTIDTNGAWALNTSAYDTHRELSEYPPTVSRITGCIARNCRDNGFHIYSAVDGVEVTHNLAENCGQAGIVITQSFGCKVRYNIVRNNGRQEGAEGFGGIRVKAGIGNEYVGNVLYNNDHGFTTWRAGGRTDSMSGTIINNLLWDNRGEGVRQSVPDARFLLKNNIITSNNGMGVKGTFEVISYNDVWGNAGGNYGGGASAGEGDISADPLFADPAKAEFHLKSKAGRWEPGTKSWVKDNVQSPCIDAGDPESPYAQEPVPNGNRMNMGAYGNTPEASKSARK